MKRLIKTIVIHCAATPNGVDIKAKAIDDMHRQRGFHRDTQWLRAFNPSLKYIGYHFVIEVDGNIALGRSLEEIGAHVQGHNLNSIGICMIGTDSYSTAQWASLKQLLITIACKVYGKPTNSIKNALAIFKMIGIDVCGHRDLSPDLNGDGVIQKNEWLKTCPGFDVRTYIDELRRELPEEMQS